MRTGTTSTTSTSTTSHGMARNRTRTGTVTRRSRTATRITPTSITGTHIDGGSRRRRVAGPTALTAVTAAIDVNISQDRCPARAHDARVTPTRGDTCDGYPLPRHSRGNRR
ncbi:hypothetical protein PUN4_900046 [Paraburkholderia unamae]|nr:hypothetical protein PUN4_900046 [Paraburkholderia unamae]